MNSFAVEDKHGRGRVSPFWLFRAWSSLVLTTLRPRLHTRIAAVLCRDKGEGRLTLIERELQGPSRPSEEHYGATT